MKRNRTLVAVLLALALAGGWGAPALVANEEHEEAHGHEAGEAEASYTLVMGEFYYEVAGHAPGEPLTLTAGQRVRLVIENEGQVFHEAMFGATLDGDHGYLDNFFEEVEVTLEHEMTMHEAPSAMQVVTMGLAAVQLDPHMSLVLTFTVPERFAGRSFEIGCFVPGHYEAGMRLQLVIAAADHDDDDRDEDGHDEDGPDEGGHDEVEHGHDDHEAIADADGDGVPDDEDYCPTFAGDPLKNGC